MTAQSNVPVRGILSIAERWWESILALKLPARLNIGASDILRTEFAGKPFRVALESILAVDVERRTCLRVALVSAVHIKIGKSRREILFADMVTAEGTRDALVAAIRQRLRTIAASAIAPLRQIKASAAAELWNSGFYVRGSVMSTWQSQVDKESVSRSIGTFRQMLNHPLMSKDGEIDAAIRLINEVVDLLSAVPKARRKHNAEFLDREAVARMDFFATVESKGLTSEQIRAALTFDDANMAVAAAGSGKTSVLVAKAGYALLSGFCESDADILALAFNAEAAKDMARRISERLTKALKRPVKIKASTFHSMGNRLLGSERRNEKRRIVQLDSAEGKRLFLNALGRLLDNDARFREALFHWLAFAKYPEPKVEASAAEVEENERRYEAACRQQLKQRIEGKGRTGASIPTLDSTVFVRSLEERAIANWLYVRQVDFRYEQPESGSMLEALFGPIIKGTKRGYKPDFSYPPPAEGKARIRHEHFGLKRDGTAPDFLGGRLYEELARKKRSAFQKVFGWLRDKGQPLPFFETTSAQFRDGTVFDVLERGLRARGIPVGQPDGERMTEALNEFRETSKAETLFLEFIQGFRESGMSRREVAARAMTSENPFRATAFLNVAFPLLDEIERAFDERGLIEFCDMLSKGAAAVRNGVDMRPYKLILVDEFQDTSRLRMELVDAIAARNPEGCVLFMVGDDWQAINRFAGADIQYFMAYAPETARQPGAHAVPDHIGMCRDGKSTHLVWLSKTFRCCQGIADVSHRFMLSTPGQLDKRVEAHSPDTQRVIKVVEHEDSGTARLAAVRKELEHLAALPQSLDHNGEPRTNEVFLLTRNMAETVVPEGLEEEDVEKLKDDFAGRLVVKRETMHGTKGLEAEYVIIAGLDTGYKGFPSLWDSDPLLELVLPPQRDPCDEERRLFYVAMTRAKKKAILLTAGNRPSQFVLELGNMPEFRGHIEWHRLGLESEVCPSCGRGTLRSIQKDTNVGCSRYPRCGFKAPREHFPHITARAGIGETAAVAP